MRKVRRWLIASLSLVLFWLVLLPGTLGGMTSYVMVDGKSMEPLLFTGDLAITSKLVPHGAGDLVVFDIGGGGLVIHRLMERDPEGKWITKGDNKPDVDPWTIADQEIVGTYLFAIDGAGAKIEWIKTRPMALGLFAALIAMLMYLPWARLLPRRWRSERIQPAQSQDEDLKTVLALTIAGALAGTISIIGLIRFGVLLSPSGLIAVTATLASASAAVFVHEARRSASVEEERERDVELV